MRIKNILLLSLIALLVLGGCTREEVVNEVIEETYVPVETTKPIKGDISQTVKLSAEVKSKEVVMITPKIGTPEEAEAVYVSVGDLVEKGQVLAKLSKENLEVQVESSRLAYELSKSNYNTQLENYESAKESFANISELYEQGAVSKTEYDNAKLRASSNQLDLMKDQLNQARFAYNNTLEMLDDLEVKSPVDGVVSDVNITVNNMTSSQNYISVYELGKVDIEFYIPEGRLNEINSGMTVEVNVPSADYIGEFTIDVIYPNKDQIKNMYKGKFTIEEADVSLRPGMKAFVIVSKRDADTYLVPVDSVLSDDDGDYLFEVIDEIAIRLPVVTGDENGEMIEILEGISMDKSIVYKGQEFIEDKEKVKVVRGE